MDNISTDILGSIIKFVKQEDIFSLAKTNKQLYKAVLLHYHFDDYKLLLTSKLNLLLHAQYVQMQ